jgi:TetR/AcrR family transcriptional regulator, transcriptional repressor for nem operon
VAARARQAFEAMSEILRVELTRAKADGDLPADLDPRRTANHLLVVFRGIEALAEAGTDPAVLRDAADAALAHAGLA